MTSVADRGNPALAVTLAGLPSPTRYASGGPAPARGTINRLFFEAVELYDRADALRFKSDGAWQSLSHRTILERVRRTALGLRALGIKPGDRVAILSENRPEWAIVDYACVTSAITDVPVYSTLPAEQIPHILNDSGARIVFVSTADQARKLTSVRANITGVTHIIGFSARKEDGCDMTLAELEALGAKEDSADVARKFRDDALAVSPGALLTLIYTSGTTGAPKGVMLTHDNVHSNCVGVSSMIPLLRDEVALSFLPLSHIFERMGAYYLFAHGATIAYAESIDAVPANMIEVQPTIMMAVPRLYEKIHARVLDNAMSAGGMKKQIFLWARDVGERWTNAKLAGKQPGGLLAMQYSLAMKLVFSKLKERTGGHMRAFVSGGAPLAPSIAKFFYSAGLPILEGYGLTETSPVITANTLDDYRLGTVGKPIRGVEVMIAPDGEILTRGPHVMAGYYNNAEATTEAITPDGWFRTGDIGELQDGFLRITDRKKDLIVTAGGKNIAPQPIENRVRANAFVAQAVMLGDKRKFPIMLVVPNWDQVQKWTSLNGIPNATHGELLAMPKVREKLETEVRSQFNGLASFETPKKIAFLEHDFSIERGELTPKLSVKRRVIEKTYASVIEALYSVED